MRNAISAIQHHPSQLVLAPSRAKRVTNGIRPTAGIVQSHATGLRVLLRKPGWRKPGTNTQWQGR